MRLGKGQENDMASQHNQQTELSANTVPLSRRQDAQTASIVNQAILFQERIGTDYAAAFLSCKGINVEVAIRVLSRPKERRRY
jgi:hypothetical protein